MAINLMFHDVNTAYTELMHMAPHYAKWEETRNGKALVFQEPVIITHTRPEHRVLFDPVRNANPFFHYMEALWMLSGDEGIKFPTQFAKNLGQYSDNGYSFHGAYGYRWREAFKMDQIDAVIEMLKLDPTTRRAVIAMWNPDWDLNSESLDLPCNTHLYFRVIEGSLNMTICNRSNDLVWGMLGANIVHMSILQEWIAESVGLKLGSMIQFTNNLHIYEGWEDKFSYDDTRFYGVVQFHGWKFSPGNLDEDELMYFVEGDVRDYKCRILRDNAVPMLAAWNEYKHGDIDRATFLAGNIHDYDWRKACVQWMLRKVDQ